VASLDFNDEVEIFKKFYNENIKTLETSLEYFRSLINSLLLDEFLLQNVSSRVKNCDESVDKFFSHYKNGLEANKTVYEIKDHITDLLGVRIVCLYELDIYKIESKLKENFDVISRTDKIKGIDETEDKFGYKSLHLDLKLDDKRKNLPENKKYTDYQFEVQIRTVIQDAWSVLDHKIKYKKTIPLELKRRVNRLAAIFELADDEFNSIREETAKYKQEAQVKNTESGVLNIISFIDSVENHFPRYQFIDSKADEFLHTVLSDNDKLTKEQFNEIIKNNIENIKKYNEHISLKMPYYNLNPYTIIRHCLYSHDKNTFKNILFETQKTNFEEWMAKQKTSALRTDANHETHISGTTPQEAGPSNNPV